MRIDAVAAPGQFDAIAVITSSRTGAARVLLPATFARREFIVAAMTGPIIERVERFRWRRGPPLAEHRNRGYAVCRASVDSPVARLHTTGQDDRVEALYWSRRKGRWIKATPLGRTVLPSDQALKFFASEDGFWAIA